MTEEPPLPCPYSNGTRCEQSDLWRSYEIAVDRVTENWIAERHRREEIEAAFKAAQQRIAELERLMQGTTVADFKLLPVGHTTR